MNTQSYKTMSITTNSKHIDYYKSKSVNRFGNPQTRMSRQAKKDAYFMRCYYGYKECEAQDGQVFFYTLTYTEKSLPHFYGVPCFSYDDIAWMMKSNGFAKSLMRNWGTALKYALFCEYGDECHRPHYHVLFYLYPFRNKKGQLSNKYPYKKIDPISFRSLVKHYWQGDMFRYEESIKGIVKEGSINLGLVQDWKAIQYCTKYAIKSVSNAAAEVDIKQNIHKHLFDQLLHDKHVWVKYIASLINGYIRPCDSLNTKNPNELLRQLHKFWCEHVLMDYPMEYMSLDYCINEKCKEFQLYLLTNPWVKTTLDDRFRTYCRILASQMEKEVYKEYLYHYGPRPRLSHGLGLSVLKEIDPYDPKIKLPSRNKWREVPISLYYYRKLFKEIVCDENTNNKVKYIDNNLAIEVKKAKLNERINKVAENLRNVAIKYNAATEKIKKQIPFNYVKRTSDYIHGYASIDALFSDAGTNIATPSLMAEDITKGVFHDMALYNEIYRDRFCVLDEECNYPTLDPIKDYENFLYPEYYYIEYDDPENKLNENKLSNNNVSLYNAHPQFQYFQQLLEFLEKADDVMAMYKDEEDDAREKLVEKVRKFIKVDSLFKNA